MEYFVKRFHSDENDTLGFMYSQDRKAECFTLEDAYHEQKIYGKTRIPAGRYELEKRMSNHFKMDMPYLKNVPGFEDIIFGHIGNTDVDTLGCLLLGDSSNLLSSEDKITNSTTAFNRVHPLIMAELEKSPCFVTITDEDK
jgi:hypothetical protein